MFAVDVVDNLICVVVILVLLISVLLQKNKADKSTSRFMLLALMALGFLVTDMGCELVWAKPHLRVLSYILNVLDYLWIDATIIAFSAYFATLVGHISKKWERIMNPAVVFTYIRMTAVVVLSAIGQLFIIDENGCYQERALAAVPYVLVLAVLAMLAAVVIRNRSHFTRTQTVVMIIYIFLPFAGALLEYFTGYYIFMSICLTVSILIIYTMVQSRIIDEYRVRESVLEEISSTDMLTRLNNRRAYYNRFASIEPREYVGVIFCDINGLKYTNDNFGHSEGDKLIIQFSELFAQYIDSKDIFRISGDEFVALVPAVSREAFEKNFEDLKKAIEDNGCIASIGSSYGTGYCVERLVSVAETEMYSNKREYYKSNNIQRGDEVPELQDK